MRRRHRCAVLGAVTFDAVLLSGGAPAWIPIVCLAGLGLGLLLDRKGRGLPDVAAKLGALALGVLFLLRIFLVEADADFRSTLLGFLSPLLLLLLLGGRDPYLAVLVSLVLAVLSAAGTGGLLPLLVTAAWLAAASGTLASLAAGLRARGAGPRVGRTRGRWRWAARLLPYPIALAGLLLGFLVYLLVPRLSEGPGVGDEAATEELARSRGERLGASGGAPASTGFPDRIRIGDLGSIRQDPRVAFIASVGSRGRPWDPAPEDRSALLLRARAWHSFDLGRGVWSHVRSVSEAVPASGRLEDGATTLDWTMSLRGYDGHVLFLPQSARVVRAPAALLVDRFGTVRSREAVRQYSVAAARPRTRLEELRGLAPDRRDRTLLQVPRSLRARLASLVEPREDLADAVAEVNDCFRRGGFRYTLRLPDALPGEGNPLTAFLDRRVGHCELFATLGCLLLRQIGVPARLAGGVRLAERLEPGVYLARYANAHAWVEVACEGAGFVAVDFTPPDEEAADAPTGGLPAARAEPSGDGPFSGATPAPLDWRNPFRYGYVEQRRLARWLGGSLDGVPLLPVLAVLAAVPLALLAVRLRRRRRRSPLRVVAAPGMPRRALAFYARWLRACAARGHTRRHAQTPREFLASLPPELRAEGIAITAEFERLRYGTRSVPPAM